jgi:hypothetical protein
MGQETLLMPWFQCPKRVQSNLEAVKTLAEDFMRKRYSPLTTWLGGMWASIIGRGGQTENCVRHARKLHCVENQENWVTPAVESLSQELER